MFGLRVAEGRLRFPTHRTVGLCDEWATRWVCWEKGSGCVGGVDGLGVPSPFGSAQGQDRLFDCAPSGLRSG